MNESLKCPVMKVVGSGFVCGPQTAARDELIAFLNALIAAEKYDPNISVSIVTDASSVCFVDFALRSAIPGFPDENQKSRNCDILIRIRSHWDRRVRVAKTKSHRPQDVSDWEDLWTLYGNHAADFTVTATIRNTPMCVRTSFDNIAAFHKEEAQRLEKVLCYLVDLNRCRVDLLHKTQDLVRQPPPQPAAESQSFMPSRAMGHEALQFLQTCAPEHYVPCFGIAAVDQSVSGGILQGANFTKAVIDWLASCCWPPGVPADYSQPDDWRISWLEMFFSFILHSRRYLQ